MWWSWQTQQLEVLRLVRGTEGSTPSIRTHVVVVKLAATAVSDAAPLGTGGSTPPDHTTFCPRSPIGRRRLLQTQHSVSSNLTVDTIWTVYDGVKMQH
jgi:hypothetical protein